MSDGENLALVALVRYADSCLPTVRHPDCPFLRSVGGVDSCNEECREEIRRLLVPGSRRIQVVPGAAFDARQSLMQDRALAHSPDHGWTTSSLLMVLEQVFQTRPWYQRTGDPNVRRLVDATSALAALAHRGLDILTLTRVGYAHVLKLSLVSWLVRPLGPDAAPLGEGAARADQWRSHLGMKSPDQGTDASPRMLADALNGSPGLKLDAWLQDASVKDILFWRLPGAEAADEELSPSMPHDEARWLVERFTRTYLSEWSLSSLRLEYQVIAGTRRPATPGGLLSERSLSRAQVSDELATRMVNGQSADSRPVDATMVRQAVQHLEDGRDDLAATLFGAQVLLEPHSAMAHQNLGFCLLPSDPGRALTSLEKARVLGGSLAINAANQAVGLYLLGRLGEALAALESAWQAAETGSAWMWRITPEGLEFDEFESLRRYISESGAFISALALDGSVAQLWEGRVRECSLSSDEGPQILHQ